MVIAISIAAFTAAQRGTPVLWLAPATGRFALPGANQNEGTFPRAIAFHDLDALAELDRRLDREIWTASGRNARLMAVRCHQAKVVIEVGADETRWPWFQVQYAEPAAKLVVCAVPLITRWQESRIARPPRDSKNPKFRPQ